jgi:hypothetical protein
MRRNNSSFPSFQWATMTENMRQFKGDNYKKNRTFVIGVADQSVLERSLNCKTDKLPSFDRSKGVIVTWPNKHHELFINPAAPDHRDMVLEFHEIFGIYLPVDVLKKYQSDHALARSVENPLVGLVKAQLIPQPANSTYGASIEKFRKGRKGLLEYDGTVPGTLLDLGKAMGFPMIGSDIEENLSVTVEMLLGSGLAPAGDRAALTACVDEAMIDIIGDS